MDVKLDLYRTFCSVARLRSLSAAGRELYLSQSAVSQAIRKLEQQLGTPLFDRSGKGVTLTQEGKVLYGYAQAALNLIETGEQKLSHLSELQAGDLHIGAGDTISQHYLLPWLGRFHELYPAVRLRVVNRTTPQLLKLLRSGRIDLAFVNLPIDDTSVDTQPCMDVHDIFVAGERFSTLRGCVLTRRQLAQQPLIMLEQLSNSRQYADAQFLSGGVQLEPEIELGAHDLLLEFAETGLGIACVVEEFSHRYLHSGKLFRLHLDEELPSRSIGVCTLRGVGLPTPGRRLLQLMLNTPSVPVFLGTE